MTQVLEIECPGCGRPLSSDMRECPACHRPVVISSFNSVYDMPALELNKYASTYQKALAADPANNKVNSALAMCFLRLKMYDKALAAFEKAIVDNFDNSESFFWAAVCVLKGRKAFLCSRVEIDKAEEYINAAIMVEPRGIYYYFWAYLRQDFHARKFLRMQPDFKTLLQEAQAHNVTYTEIDQLFDILAVPKPDAIAI
ncbi:MAG: hypothetical protein IJS92_05155 [Paludibacteraceae bacterium]|nr:hypothetical protein [Paludibacteraceae bacterium]